VPWACSCRRHRPRDVLARMLRNLKEVHRSACDWQRLAAVQRRLVVLLPQAWDERRDHALVLAELGRHALADVRALCVPAAPPDALDAPALRRHLASLARPALTP
jgi:regulator of sirC expression with transglutaminase-like and TPR domain